MDMSPVGVWSTAFTHGDPDRARAAACELEELGYGTLWLGGVPGGNPGGDLHSSLNLLTATRHAIVAPSCVSIWNLPPGRLAAAYHGLAEPYRRRTLVGLAVSHADITAAYQRPYTAMTTYLDALDTSTGPLPKAARFLGAHRPRMTQLAAGRAAGVQPYLVPPSHTARARAVLGPGPLLAPVQTSVVDANPVTARATARRAIAPYLTKPNYVRTWLEGGFTQGDFTDGGSDRFVDSLVVRGSPDVVARRVLAHLEAGANHVALQIITDTPNAFPLSAWRAVAERLPRIWPTLSTASASRGPRVQAPGR
ncbi:TIGR03620 family F420-dependent LLM class oxidoreductase [Streptomyces roseoverticillatus]|uniref:TIGR03620 family F420-dependent LLM class oxidoreductase n=1 Tax=Streptomyces roseoverticillatus TaxID=66429 RepID=UPI00340191D5